MTSHPEIYLLRRENFMDLLSNTTNTAKEKVTKVTGSKEDKRNKAKAKTQEKFKLNARTIAQIGMLSALATILMLFEIPLWFAPSFYQIDLSELPVLIGGFALGPVAGILIELVKNLLKLAISGTSTGGVGEFANFLIGCSFVLPSAIYYRRHRSKQGAAISMIIGTISMAILGGFLNAYLLLPFYSKAYGLPLEALIEMGTAVNGKITSMTTFVMFAVVPFNLFKGFIVSVVTAIIYKKIRIILH
jgi:riboflavin transporter FmnP